MKARGYLLAVRDAWNWTRRVRWRDAWNWVRPRLRWRDVFIIALIGISMLYSVSYYHRSAAAQQRQGQMVELKLCTTLVKLAALRPPSGSPGANPSRAYDQELHAALAQLSPDIGCRR